MQSADIEYYPGEVLQLESTNKLWKKRYRNDIRLGIAKLRVNKEFSLVVDPTFRQEKFVELDIGGLNIDEVDTLIDGIIADLISMSAVNAMNVHKWVKRRQSFMRPPTNEE